jgi:cyclophilin family peptidyl-prolyl cis-trans isomerase
VPPRQRRRRRGPATYAGPKRAKPPFPINLIFNVKAFYLFFILVMIASIGAVGLAPGGGGGRDRLNPDDPAVVEPTPNTAMVFDAPAPTIDGTQPHVATIKTDKGDIKIELVTDAPQTVNSFAFLAGAGFYDGTTFFYVDRDYVAQAGDPGCRQDGENVCSGTGDPGYSLKLEKTQETHEQWAVVAPTLNPGGEDIHGSQFRILFKPDPRLDGQETVFGKVIEGQEILEGLNDLAPCSAVSSEACNNDLSSALVIRDVIVTPAAAVAAQ